ncbi:MAG: phosphatidate cytidylyltransferase [Eggerthellaceae bacterium]|jgi:phosphatidate cytidylyltransferase
MPYNADDIQVIEESLRNDPKRNSVPDSEDAAPSQDDVSTEEKDSVEYATDYGARPPRSHRAAKRARRWGRVKSRAYDKAPDRFKNASDIQVRFRTGFVYISLTILGVVINDLTTMILLAATAGICASEFYYMLRADAKLPNEVLGVLGAMAYPVCVYFFGLHGTIYVTFVLVLALIIWYVYWMRARIADVGVSLIGAIYTGFLISGILIIRQSIDDDFTAAIVMLLLFLSVWTNDIFAYLIGRKFGKHKLAPRTSPKKSWEGFFAGLVASAFFWCLMCFVPGVNMDIPTAIVFGLICGCMCVVGDLAESRIKRNVGVKDSGTIMPGHGGLFDRCDSLFLGSCTACLLMAFGHVLPIVL